jgi:phage shock protein A
MGIFSRMGDIINSNLNAMIEAAEDPEKIARLIIQEMEDTLVEVRTDAARHIAERKELTRREEDYRNRADDWASKAELAITKDREDLARGALQAKRQADDMADVVAKEIEVLDEAIAKADGDLAKLQTKLDEAKAKHKSLTMRSTVAKSQVKMRSKIVDTRVDDALARYERMERKVDELEAHVEAFDLGEGESLESQFAALEADDELEDELAALKAKMTKPKAANKSDKTSKPKKAS